MKEKLDLVAMRSQRGDSCYREIAGEKVYDFRRVVITVTRADGSTKKYELNRATCGHQTYAYMLICLYVGTKHISITSRHT